MDTFQIITVICIPIILAIIAIVIYMYLKIREIDYRSTHNLKNIVQLSKHTNLTDPL